MHAGRLEQMLLKQVVEGTETRAGRFFDSIVTGSLRLYRSRLRHCPTTA